MTRLMVIQPYVPAYRVPFFRALRRELRAQDVDLVVVAGRPEGRLDGRGDDRSKSEADQVVPVRHVGLGSKTLLIRDIVSVMRAQQPGFVVVEQAIKNLESYPLLARQALGGGAKVGMWGQGRTFSTRQGRVARGLKDLLTRYSDWFFAYTEAGAQYVIQAGVPANHVTVLNNSIDSEQLRRDLNSISEDDVTRFQRDHHLTPGLTATFMGGVDPNKGIAFLLESAREVAKSMPGFRLLVIGAGSSEPEVRARQAAGDPVVALGRMEGRAKALALRSSDVMMIPEWVGLVAVDSLVAGRPIMTTYHPSHAPEFAYLENRRNAFIFAHDVSSYSTGIASVLRDPARLQASQVVARRDSYSFSISEMAHRFARGVEAWRRRYS